MKQTKDDEYEAAYAEAVEIIKQEWLAAGMSEEEWIREQELAERINRQAGERWLREQRAAEKRARATGDAGTVALTGSAGATTSRPSEPTRTHSPKSRTRAI